MANETYPHMEGAQPTILAQDGENPSLLGRAREWASKRKTRLLLGVTAASMGVTLAVNPVEPVLNKVEEAAPWVVPTEVGLDLTLGIGFAMMATSATGAVVRNPFKAKTYLKDLPEKANNSTLFKSGYRVALGSGYAWGGVAVGSIISYLPPEAWGSLVFPAASLANTVLFQKAVGGGIKASAQNNTTEGVGLH